VCLSDCDSLKLVKVRSHRSQSYNNRWIHPTFIKQPRQSIHPCFSIFSLSIWHDSGNLIIFIFYSRHGLLILIEMGFSNYSTQFIQDEINRPTTNNPLSQMVDCSAVGVVCSIESTNMDCYN